MNTATAFKKLSLSVAVTASTVVAGLTALPASASSFTGTGSGFLIPDNNPAGASSDIVVPDSFSITDITVTLNNPIHGRIGDLIATLTHVDTATTVSLFNRIGRVGSGTGDDSNFAGGNNYSFNDAFTGDLWAVAASGGSAFVIPGGDYFPTGADSSAEVPMLASLGGQLSSGTWRLTISDNAMSSGGSLGNGWTLNLQGTMATVPEPSSNLGLLALGLLGAGAALKRKLN